MGKWTRRAFLSTGLLVGGGFAVGVALRPGNRTGELSKYVAHDGETLVHTWVKLDGQNQVTAIVPHAEMGQGVGTSLAQMLADELDRAESAEPPAKRSRSASKQRRAGAGNVPQFGHCFLCVARPKLKGKASSPSPIFEALYCAREA